MSKISVKMPHLLLAITSANFVIFLVSDNSTSWRGKRLHFPVINSTGYDNYIYSCIFIPTTTTCIPSNY